MTNAIPSSSTPITDPSLLQAPKPIAEFDEITRVITITSPNGIAHSIAPTTNDMLEHMPAIFKFFQEQLQNNPAKIMEYVQDQAGDVEGGGRRLSAPYEYMNRFDPSTGVLHFYRKLKKDKDATWEARPLEIKTNSVAMQVLKAEESVASVSVTAKKTSSLPPAIDEMVTKLKGKISDAKQFVEDYEAGNMKSKTSDELRNLISTHNRSLNESYGLLIEEFEAISEEPTRTNLDSEIGNIEKTAGPLFKKLKELAKDMGVVE